MRTQGRDERRPDAGSVRAALTLAQSAPSVHNSQPWRWCWDGVHAASAQGAGVVDLYADRSRWLPATDPRGTDLLTSCGVVLHHARVAFAAEGWAVQVQYLPEPADPDHLARLTFRAMDVESAHIWMAEAILQRHTDRRWYSDERVPEDLLTELIRAAEHQGARAARLTRPGFRVGLSDVLRTARLQNWDPRYVEELDRVTDRFQTEQAGIPAANRTANAGHLNRDFPAGTLADPAPNRPERAELLVLGATGPGPLGALITGEAGSAVLLCATAVGLASCVLSQPLESASARRRIRAMLDEPMEPLLLVRLGWPNSAEPIPPTPRRPLAEVLTAGPKVSDGGDFRSMTTEPATS